jgi:hypothetical protein
MQKWSNRPLRPINSNPLPADPEISITLTAKPYIATTSRDDYYGNTLKTIKSYRRKKLEGKFSDFQPHTSERRQLILPHNFQADDDIHEGSHVPVNFSTTIARQSRT